MYLKSVKIHTNAINCLTYQKITNIRVQREMSPGEGNYKTLVNEKKNYVFSLH